MKRILHFVQDDKPVTLSESEGSFSFFFAVPVVAEVSPRGIGGDNQGHFFRPQPSFDLFLPLDGRADVAPGLAIHQAIDVVSAREAGKQLALVLEHALFQIVRHARGECASVVGHDLDVIGFHCGKFTTEKDSSPWNRAYAPACHPFVPLRACPERREWGRLGGRWLVKGRTAHARGVPWRCHRSPIAETVTDRGVQAEHSIARITPYAGKLTPLRRTRNVERMKSRILYIIYYL